MRKTYSRLLNGCHLRSQKYVATFMHFRSEAYIPLRPASFFMYPPCSCTQHPLKRTYSWRYVLMQCNYWTFYYRSCQSVSCVAVHWTMVTVSCKATWAS